MAYPETFDPKLGGSGVPNRGSDEETEMLKNDPAERAVPAVGMDEIAESGDRDPLIGTATGHIRQAGERNDGASENASRAPGVEG